MAAGALHAAKCCLRSEISVHVVVQRYKAAKVVGAPIAGFYFFAFPYDGPGHTEGLGGLADFREQAFSGYWALWDPAVDDTCRAALNMAPWKCMVLCSP